MISKIFKLCTFSNIFFVYEATTNFDNSVHLTTKNQIFRRFLVFLPLSHVVRSLLLLCLFLSFCVTYLRQETNDDSRFHLF